MSIPLKLIPFMSMAEILAHTHTTYIPYHTDIHTYHTHIHHVHTYAHMYIILTGMQSL